MRLGEWLEMNNQVCDTMGIYCRVFISEDVEFGPIFEGMLDDIPWSLMKYEIGRCNEDDCTELPIFFVDKFSDEEDNVISRPGFVINILEYERNK